MFGKLVKDLAKNYGYPNQAIGGIMGNLRAVAKIRDNAGVDNDYVVVEIHWEGEPLDRPYTTGIHVAKKNHKLAQRLVRCINAQKAFEHPHVARDTNGKSYVSFTLLVIGKYLNADLKRLGF